MPDLRILITEYLESNNMMQIATCINNIPWCCTVYYAMDDDLNLYWISKPERRHSKEAEVNSNISSAVVSPHVPGDPVRGISIEGGAGMISKDSVEFDSMFSNYSDKFGWSDDAIEEMRSGENTHELYVLRPSSIVLLDTVNFKKGEERQGLKL